MKVLLFQLDGKLPNIALMRIASHYRKQGHDVELRITQDPAVELFDRPDLVFASAIFSKSIRAVEKLEQSYPEAVKGGTGINLSDTLEGIGIRTLAQDYSIYPGFRQSIGFSQRGCRMSCSFCVVPSKEGKMRNEQSIMSIWRGDPHPKELLLLDNDFFGQEGWRDKITGIRNGGFKVSFVQGINARFMTDEAAEAISSIDYRDDSMKSKRIYTAWDNRKDEERLFAGLNRLVKYGVKPQHIMVYMLVGYWPGETEEDRLYRWGMVRDFGAMPYPMPFVRTPELVGFQRWCIGAYDKRITWDRWKKANYRPENL